MKAPVTGGFPEKPHKEEAFPKLQFLGKQP
jgi:hypothetical protein